MLELLFALLLALGNATARYFGSFASFCAWQLGALIFWWLLIRATTGRHAHALVAGSSVYIRPRWLPIAVLQALHTHPLAIFASAAAALALGALAPTSLAVRCLLALAICAYHLVESSASSRHGEYPL